MRPNIPDLRAAHTNAKSRQGLRLHPLPVRTGYLSPGLAGDQVIHSILDPMYAKAPYTVMQRAMHIHPTVSEFIPTMLGDLKPLQ
jgi:hypothetical protein